MIELIYSQESAPEIPARTAATSSIEVKTDEWLPVTAAPESCILSYTCTS